MVPLTGQFFCSCTCLHFQESWEVFILLLLLLCCLPHSLNLSSKYESYMFVPNPASEAKGTVSTKVSSSLLLLRENPNPNSPNTQSTRRKEEQQLARFHVPFDSLALEVTWATQI